jgi:hypothetical protein
MRKLRPVVTGAVAAAAAAAASIAVIVLAVTPAAATNTRPAHRACVSQPEVGNWAVTAIHTAGAEAGTIEQFEDMFLPSGAFIQASGTVGDTNAQGSWRASGSRFVVTFNAFNQGDPTTRLPTDLLKFHIVITGVVTGDTFDSTAQFVGIDTNGNPVRPAISGTAHLLGKKIESFGCRQN